MYVGYTLCFYTGVWLRFPGGLRRCVMDKSGFCVMQSETGCSPTTCFDSFSKLIVFFPPELSSHPQSKFGTFGNIKFLSWGWNPIFMAKILTPQSDLKKAKPAAMCNAILTNYNRYWPYSARTLCWAQSQSGRCGRPDPAVYSPAWCPGRLFPAAGGKKKNNTIFEKNLVILLPPESLLGIMSLVFFAISDNFLIRQNFAIILEEGNKCFKMINFLI